MEKIERQYKMITSRNRQYIYFNETCIYVCSLDYNDHSKKIINAVNTIDEACEMLFQCQTLLNEVPLNTFSGLTPELFLSFMKRVSDLIIESQSGLRPEKVL